MCFQSRTTCLIAANIVAILFTLILLVYSSLLLHLLFRMYGVYESNIEPPGYMGSEQPEVYMQPPPPGPVHSQVTWPLNELSWFDRLRLWFGDDDLNNYQGQNVFTQNRIKRNVLYMNTPTSGSYDMSAVNSMTGNAWTSKGIPTNEWPDTAPLPHSYYWFNGLWKNSTFVLALLLIVFACSLILLHMYHIVAVGYAQSRELTAPSILRIAGILSLVMAFVSACFALYASLCRSSAVTSQQRQLILAYRWYDRNDFRRSPTHYIDELQVALNCCGADRPAELISSQFGFGPSVAAQLPRSCCARDRDELIALRAPMFEPPLASVPSVSNAFAPGPSRMRNVLFPSANVITSAAMGQCDLRQLPPSNNQGCVPVVRHLMITLFNWILLFGITMLCLHLYLAFACWALAIDRAQTRTSAF